MLHLISKTKADERRAFALYNAIVAHARHPSLYTDHHVPDTIDGRFDMLTLHAILVIRRIRSDGGRDLAQRLFDVMFLDMDQALRESGFGDTAVPRRIKQMAEVFYGRAAAYGAALDGAEDADPLADVVARNVFPDGDIEGAAASLARYIEAVSRWLQAQTADAILAGTADWPDPARFAGAQVTDGETDEEAGSA